MKGTVRIIWLDPGWADPFGAVGIQGSTSGGPAHVRYAREWVRPPIPKGTTAVHMEKLKRKYYDLVCSYIAADCSKIKPDILAVEQNKDGKLVSEILETKYKLKVTRITTTGHITDAKLIQSGLAMDKNKTVIKVAQLKRNHDILFPALAKSKGIKKLATQISEFTQYKYNDGTIKYRGTKNRHDDLVMSLVGACHVLDNLREEKRRSNR